MVTSLVRRLVPRWVRESISAGEDYLRFDLYANRIVAARIRPELAARDQPLQHLMVLSAPRSGSTILGRLLNANPAIAGFGESRTSYSTLADLDRLTYRTAAMIADFDARKTDWVFDKIVGPFDISEDVLSQPHLRYLFIDRDPFAIYQSTIRLFDLPHNAETATNWSREYSERLDQLIATLRSVAPGTAAWFSYEDLLENPSETLAHLTTFLDLAVPLTDTFPSTSGPVRLKYGDISGNLSAGKLVKINDPLPEPDPAVFDKELIDFVRTAHRMYIECLSNHATSRKSTAAQR